jgi:hypothetical protein
MYRHFPYPTSRNGTRTHKLLMPRLLGHRKTLHTMHPARSNRHHMDASSAAIQGTHSTASELLVYTTALMKNQAYMQSGPQQKSVKKRHEIQPQKYLSTAPGLCRLLPPNHLIPTKKLQLFVLSRRNVCLCIHWVLQNKSTSMPIAF